MIQPLRHKLIITDLNFLIILRKKSGKSNLHQTLLQPIKHLLPANHSHWPLRPNRSHPHITSRGLSLTEILSLWVFIPIFNEVRQMLLEKFLNNFLNLRYKKRRWYTDNLILLPLDKKFYVSCITTFYINANYVIYMKISITVAVTSIWRSWITLSWPGSRNGTWNWRAQSSISSQETTNIRSNRCKKETTK